MYYLEPEQLEVVFGVIQENYARLEEVPDYSLQTSGMEGLFGILKAVRADYYPTLLDKATYLLVQINKGHLFSNGNKRLALVITGMFLDLNNQRLRELPKEEYKNILAGLFPEFEKFEDFPEFSGIDFGTYNLSIIIADSTKYNISFDSLKKRIKGFFAATVES